MAAGFFERVEGELTRIDPLWARLAGIEVEPGLPDASRDRERTHRETLDGLIAEMASQPARDDLEAEMDHLALEVGLRRSLPLDGPRAPFGARSLERFLLAELALFDGDPLPLAAALERAPIFLEQSREGCEGCAPEEVEIALAAAKRIPSILDAISGLAATLAIPERLRMESALGQALDAAAADGGWLLKDLLASASSRPIDEPLLVGAGASLDEIEAWAEDQLAARVVDAEKETRGSSSEVALAEAIVEAAARETAGSSGAWCHEPDGGDFVVERAPDWLIPLLPAVALIPAPPLSRRAHRLLFRPGTRVAAEQLATDVARIHAVDYLPAAWRQARARRARMLRPAPEADAGWRQHARMTNPAIGFAARASAGAEAALALVAVGLVQGALDHPDAARMIAAETGVDADTAELQVAHVAADPGAAMLPVVGGQKAEAALSRLAARMGEAEARVALLTAGPISGTALDLLG